MFEYLEWKFFDGHELSSSTIRGNLYRVPFAEHCAMVSMMFLARAITPRALATADLHENEAPMRTRTYGGTLFPLP